MTTPQDDARAEQGSGQQGTAQQGTGQQGTVQQGTSVHGDHVPVPAGGVRGVDQVDAVDNAPGQGTTTGADGQTAAREELRRGLGERGGDTRDEKGDDLEQAAALGATDDPQGGSLQPDGAAGA